MNFRSKRNMQEFHHRLLHTNGHRSYNEFSIAALIRTLDPLLMMEDKEVLKQKLQNIARTLLECDGLAIDASAHPENVKDGIVSKFVLSINDADFEAVLNLAEPFYRHAEHALMSLPEETTEERKVTNKGRFCIASHVVHQAGGKSVGGKLWS